MYIPGQADFARPGEGMQQSLLLNVFGLTFGQILFSYQSDLLFNFFYSSRGKSE